jgi:hypothetical protein
MQMMVNIGSTLIYLAIISISFIVYFFLWFLTYLLSSLNTCSRLEKLHLWIKQKLFWGFPLGFLLQQYQPIVMLSIINFYRVKTDTIMQTFSIVLSSILMFICVLSLPIIYRITLKFTREEDEVYTKKFGVLNDGFHFSGWISRNWNFLILTRWLIVSIILVSLREYYCF